MNRLYAVALGATGLAFVSLSNGCGNFKSSDVAAAGQAGDGSSGSGTAGSGTAGSGTAGSGTAGSGTAGTAGSGTAGSGTSGSGGSGTAGTGGGSAGSAPCTDVTACGGNVVGTWNASSSCLMVTGAYDISPFGIGCTSGTVSGSLQVTGTLSVMSDGTYMDNTHTTGTEQIELAKACLTFSGTTTTCDGLVGPFGAGGYSMINCVDAAGGGCSCTVMLDQMGGMALVNLSAPMSGTYTIANNALTMTDGFTETSFDYCVAGSALTMTPKFTKQGMITGSILFQKQ